MMAMAGCGIVLPVSADAAHAADAVTEAKVNAKVMPMPKIQPCRIAARYLILTKWWSFHNPRR